MPTDYGYPQECQTIRMLVGASRDRRVDTAEVHTRIAILNYCLEQITLSAQDIGTATGGSHGASPDR